MVAYGNPRHDRRTGRFVNAAHGRVQSVQRIGDLPDDEWAIDEAAMVILEAGMARAVQDGWLPPTPADDDAAEVTT